MNAPSRPVLDPINGCAPAAIINEVLAVEDAVLDLVKWSDQISAVVNKHTEAIQQLAQVLWSSSTRNAQIAGNGPSLPVESASPHQATNTPETVENTVGIEPDAPVVGDDGNDWGN